MERCLHRLVEGAATDQGSRSVDPHCASFEHDANGFGAPDEEPCSCGAAQAYRFRQGSDGPVRSDGRVILGRQVSTARCGGRPQYHSRWAPGQLPRAHTPFCTSRTSPDEASRSRMRWAASIGTPSHVCRVFTDSVTLGFCTMPSMTRCTTAARFLMFRRSSPMVRCLRP